MAILALPPAEPISYLALAGVAAFVVCASWAAPGRSYWDETKYKGKWAPPVVWAFAGLTMFLTLMSWTTGVVLLTRVDTQSGNSTSDACEGHEPLGIVNYCALGFGGVQIAYFVATGAVAIVGALFSYGYMLTHDSQSTLPDREKTIVHVATCLCVVTMLVVNTVSVSGRLWSGLAVATDLNGWRALHIVAAIVTCGSALAYMVRPGLFHSLEDSKNEHAKYVVIERHDDANDANDVDENDVSFVNKFVALMFPTLTTQRVGVKLPWFVVAAFMCLVVDGNVAINTQYGNIMAFVTVVVVVPVLMSLVSSTDNRADESLHATTMFLIPLFFVAYTVIVNLAFLPIILSSLYSVALHSRWYQLIRFLSPSPNQMTYVQATVDSVHYVLSGAALVFVCLGWPYEMKWRIMRAFNKAHPL